MHATLTVSRHFMNHALIFIDLIEDYFDRGIWPDSDLPDRRSELMAAANELSRICRARGVPVVWIRQEFSADFSDAFLHARRAGTRYAIAGTPGAALAAGLEARPDEAVLTKKRFSAFFGTGLNELLVDLQATTVILAGITTAWCVRSTAVDAYQCDFEVILATDCMAAFDEASHRASLTAMDGYIATCMTNAEVADRLDLLHRIQGAAAREG
ncbi:MAG: cysteine hydrolase [Rhodothermales bacterium]